MRISAIAAGVIGATLLAGNGVCADNEAGVPLRTAEAVGAWSLESSGQSLCVLDLGPRHTVRSQGACGGALPSTPAGWAPAADGMRLVSADGQTLMNFHRWSNSLFVAHTPSGDLQLRRGR
jgi:hypothetical protein